MVVMAALIFAIALWHTGDVPISYGLATHSAAVRHGVEPLDLGSLLLAENRGRVYDPSQIGRYGDVGELGLYQLAPVWSRHCGVSRRDLLDAWINIDCAARAAAEMQRWHDRYCWRYQEHSWVVHYRCAASESAWSSQRCGWSVGRVRKAREVLERNVSLTGSWTWIRATATGWPLMVARSVR
jgi:hypothetical protein